MTTSIHKAVLSAENLDVTGTFGDAASGIVAINGDFEGTIEVLGSNDGLTWGPRLIFKSGVGCLGTNIVSNDGSPFDREYRVVLNGESIRIIGSNWVDGTANVSISTSPSTAMVFVNGPVHCAEEQALRNFRAFTASTGAQDVGIGNAIACTLKNPANSNVNIFLRRRLFGNNRATNESALEYVAYGNPTFVGSQSSSGLNLRAGGPSSIAGFTYQVDSVENITMGGFLGTGEILPRGEPYTREVDFMIAPGGGVGFLIQGAGQNLLQAARVSITFEWYEEAVN